MWNILWIFNGCIEICGNFYGFSMDVTLKTSMFSRLPKGEPYAARMSARGQYILHLYEALIFTTGVAYFRGGLGVL